MACCSHRPSPVLVEIHLYVFIFGMIKCGKSTNNHFAKQLIGLMLGANLTQNLLYLFYVILDMVICSINKVQDEIRVSNFLQSCFKCSDQVMRQLSNKTHRINQNRCTDVRKLNPPERWIQCSEQLIGCINTRIGKLII